MVARLRPSRWLRLLRHRLRALLAPAALSQAALDRLEQRIGQGEQLHHGQVRICVEAGLPASYLWRDATPRERAITLFGKLGIWDTEHNNGVLIYLLLAEHAIEVVADRGVAEKVGPGTWERVVADMAPALRAGDYEAALTQAVAAVSAVLQMHFPRPGAPNGPSASNELPDAPVCLR